MRGERRRRSSCEKHNQGSSVFTPEITILKSKVPEGGEEGELLDEQGDGGGRGGRRGGTTAEADGEAGGEVAFEEAEGGGESVQGGVGGVVVMEGVDKGG